MSKTYYVYILTNTTNTVLYVGVTNSLSRRLYQHNQNVENSFTKRYRVCKLVYYEVYNDVKIALYREKQLKGWKRCKKEQLINSLNPTWDELNPL